MGLWNVWDPKLKELGLITNQDEVAKAMYDGAARAVLTQLRRIPKGSTIEEDHQRDRALIANYIMDKTGAIEQIKRDGKTLHPGDRLSQDARRRRTAAGGADADQGEGDHAAIKALVDKYGVHFDPVVRDEVVARFKALNLPTYWAGVNTRLTATVAPDGKATSVEMSYPRDPVRQYLEYAQMYDAGLTIPAGPNTGDAR